MYSSWYKMGNKERTHSTQKSTSACEVIKTRGKLQVHRKTSWQSPDKVQNNDQIGDSFPCQTINKSQKDQMYFTHTEAHMPTTK